MIKCNRKNFYWVCLNNKTFNYIIKFGFKKFIILKILLLRHYGIGILI